MIRLMTIIAQLNLLLAACQAWATPKQYKAEIVGRFSTLQSQFTEQSPQGMRVAVMYLGEDKAGEYEEALSLPVNRKFLIVASAGRGFVEPGDQRETAGHIPVWTGLEQLRDAVRRVRFDDATTDVIPDFRNVGVFAPDGRPTDAYQMEVTIGTRLPAPSEE